jgi:hypothetical protein
LGTKMAGHGVQRCTYPEYRLHIWLEWNEMKWFFLKVQKRMQKLLLVLLTTSLCEGGGIISCPWNYMKLKFSSKSTLQVKVPAKK